MKKYLIRDQFGDYYFSDEISEDDIESCKDGYIDIINIEEGTEMFTDGSWNKVDTWKG